MHPSDTVIQASANDNRYWTETFLHGSINSVRQTSDGGYIAVGSIDSWIPNKDDLWLVKTDAYGNRQWDKSFGGLDDDWGSSVQQTNDGGYIIIGITFSNGAGRDDAWLIKTDANGNMQWDKPFGGRGQDWGTSVQQTSDGGYILLIVSDDDILLIKTDANGNEQWNKPFGNSDCNNYGYFVQQTNDGGYIIVGSTCTLDNSNERTRDAWLIKTDTYGNKQWDRTFGGSGYDEGYSVRPTNDGGYIIAGYTDNEAWLIKTDTYGNELWNKPLGMRSPCTILSGNSLWLTQDGGCITVGISGDNVSLVKTDTGGNKIWDRIFEKHGGSCSKSIQQTTDGGYVVAGISDYGRNSPNFNSWLIKTDTNGNV